MKPQWHVSFAFTGEEWEAEGIEYKIAGCIGLITARLASYYPSSRPVPITVHDYVIIPLAGTTYLRRINRDAE